MMKNCFWCEDLWRPFFSKYQRKIIKKNEWKVSCCFGRKGVLFGTIFPQSVATTLKTLSSSGSAWLCIHTFFDLWVRNWQNNYIYLIPILFSFRTAENVKVLVIYTVGDRRIAVVKHSYIFNFYYYRLILFFYERKISGEACIGGLWFFFRFIFKCRWLMYRVYYPSKRPVRNRSQNERLKS